jgi:hemolysin activation/secretion protein
VRWNYILPKWGEIEQKVAFGLDYRAFKNDATDALGTLITPDITVRPASVTYSGLRRMTAAELSYYAGLVRNLPGGDDGEREDFEASRPGANENYTLLRYGINYVRQFRNEWQMRVGLNGQATNDSLVSGEQYGVGGPDSVRGYPLRDVAGDKGYSGQAEIYTPDVARGIGMSDDYKARFLGFYDWGTVSYNNLPPTGVRHDSIASVGVGVRFTYKKTLSVRLDLAHTRQETPTRDNNTQRLTGSLALVF